MQNIMKKTAAGALMGGSLLFTGGMGLAQAAPLNVQDGLVNVGLGDVTLLENVNVGVAANVVAAICGLQVPVNADVLSQVTAVDESSTNDTVCEVAGGPVEVQQNAGTPGNSGGAGNSENSNAGGNR
jgi:hypothetical protein